MAQRIVLHILFDSMYRSQHNALQSTLCHLYMLSLYNSHLNLKLNCTSPLLRNMHCLFLGRCIYLHTVLDRSSMKHRTFRRNKPRRSRTLHLYNHCSMPTYYCTYLSLRNMHCLFLGRCIYLHTVLDRSSMKHRTFRRNKPRRSRTLHLYNHCSMPTYYCTYLSLRNMYYPFQERCIYLHTVLDRLNTMFDMYR